MTDKNQSPHLFFSNFLFLLFLLFYFYFQKVEAQSINSARQVIERLSAPDLHGRGYVLKGDQKAAEYIENQFKKLGLKAYGKDHLQKFSIPVNTFPGDLELVINDKTLVAGKDYLINPCSPSIKGSFKVSQLDKAALLDRDLLNRELNNSKGNFVLIDRRKLKEENKEVLKSLNETINALKYNKDLPVKGVIELTVDKLTWHASTDVCKIASFTIYAPELSEEIKQIRLKVENSYHPNYQTQNVIGYIKGAVKPDSLLVITAHYDHLGRMGRHTYFPGANDNASGVAFMLDLAKHYSQPENAPPYTMVFIAFGAEEIGLLGSAYFVENPLFPLKSIKFLINFDISGTGDEGITVVNGKIYEDKFNLLSSINNEHQFLSQVKSRGEACNSDHCLFHLKKVPSFFIYTLGGIKAYHDVYDIAETLPLTKYEEYFQLLTHFIKEL